jgi:hypothetical protein
MPSCLQLAGSLSATKLSLNAVGSSLDTFVEMLVVDASRNVATDSGTFVYYIDVAANLNSLITYTASATGDLNDDAYAFSGFSRTDDASANVYLPEISDVNVPAGLIDANNVPKGILAGTFPVNLTVAVNDKGLMTASILISGSNVTSDVVDTNLKAQVAYWNVAGVSTPSPTPTSADVLEATLAASQLNNHFSAALATVLAYYHNKQMLTTWTIALSSIASGNDNSLAKHARNIGNTGTSAVFAQGAKVMAITPFSYRVDIVDYLAASTAIIAPANVYGVITQL